VSEESPEWQILSVVNSTEPLPARRERLGALLLRVLDADIFVSYRSDEVGPYADPVAVNLDQSWLHAYANRYRHIDEVTPHLYQQGGAAVVPVRGRARSEYVKDFLHRAGMHHGINYFPALAAAGSLDLRLWRSRAAEPFTDQDVRRLQLVGDLMHRLWQDDASSGTSPLTPRELQIARLVAEGMTDQSICERLHISLPTLRTHLRNAFAKVGATNRAALATHVVLHRQK